jgi:putative SOS response-associated peptidase YedK
MDDYMPPMCGRVIQSSGPVRYAIVDGMNVRDSRLHNCPPRWNAAPSQELLVIRRNHKTGEVSLDPLRWGLIPYWCQDPTGGRKLGRSRRSCSAHLKEIFFGGTRGGGKTDGVLGKWALKEKRQGFNHM